MIKTNKNFECKNITKMNQETTTLIFVTEIKND